MILFHSYYHFITTSVFHERKNPVFMRVSWVMLITPIRSCQKFSKQICLWDLAQSIGILFIIQIVEAI